MKLYKPRLTKSVLQRVNFFSIRIINAWNRLSDHVISAQTTNMFKGWSGGAMVLGKLPVPGRPANLDYSRARAYCACSGCGWGLFLDIFSLAYHFFLPLFGRRPDID